MIIPSNIPMPDGMTKEEIKEVLLREEYGYLPPKPDKVYAEEVETEEKFCAGKVIRKSLKIHFEAAFGKGSFPVNFTYPKSDKKVPLFVHINFRPDVPDRYQPTEEICDRGYAVMSFCYKDVTDDKNEFESGIAKLIYPNGRKNPTDCGKLGIWACPPNEYLSCILADKYYRDAGKNGFIHPDRLPETGEVLHEGDIAYHIREGRHYLSREDWNYFIDYLNK